MNTEANAAAPWLLSLDLADPCDKSQAKRGLMRIDPTKPQFTSVQTIAILVPFADTLLALLKDLGEDDRGELALLVEDVSLTMRRLAPDIGEGDPDVAFEVVTSCARLIGVLRHVTKRQPNRSSLH